MRASRAVPLALPLALFDAAVFVTAVAYALIVSLSAGGYFLENYARIFADALFRDVLIRTMWFSGCASLIAVVLGYVVALHLWGCRGRTRALLTLIVVSPLLVSVVVRTFGWVVLLGGTGPLAQALHLVGFANARLLYSPAGVIAALVHVHLPYAVLAILAALDNLDPLLLRAAASLGASPSKAFASVVLPLSVPGMVTAAVVTFILNMGSFVTPLLVGGPRQLTLGGYVYQEVAQFFHEGTGYAAAVVTLGIAVLLTLGVVRLVRVRISSTLGA